MKWEQGQTVVIVSGRMRGGQDVAVTTIKKVWKNGVVEIDPGDGHRGNLYNPNGCRRGQGTGWHSDLGSIRPLADGEVAESVRAIIADRKRLDTERAERDARKRAETIETWWSETGQAIWLERISLPDKFMGETVHIIRYGQHDQQYMPFIIVREEGRPWRDDNAKETVLTVGGLTGQTYADVAGVTKKSISTFSNSTIRADSLREALYSLCN